MRFASSQLCTDLPSTSYCHRSGVNVLPRQHLLGQQVKRHTALRAQGSTLSDTQSAWDRLELITRLHLHCITSSDVNFCCTPRHWHHSQSPKSSLCHYHRKLAVAVSEENYNLAAQLSSEKQSLSEELPAVSQYTFHQLQELQEGLKAGSLSQQLSAVRALGNI